MNNGLQARRLSLVPINGLISPAVFCAAPTCIVQWCQCAIRVEQADSTHPLHARKHAIFWNTCWIKQLEFVRD